MAREMVEVVLYENGEYEVNGADPHHVTMHMVGMGNKGRFESYYCPKNEWKHYLLQMVISTKDIDWKIEKLKEQKKAREELAAKIKKELGL
jgi:hypothetical protein